MFGEYVVPQFGGPSPSLPGESRGGGAGAPPENSPKYLHIRSVPASFINNYPAGALLKPPGLCFAFASPTYFFVPWLFATSGPLHGQRRNQTTVGP